MAAALFAGTGLYANDFAQSVQPYASIVSRNIFGLAPISTDKPQVESPENPPPKITPNGIINIFGKVQVLFKVSANFKPCQPTVGKDFYVLGVGERQDEIEVTEINEQTDVVTFNNHGTIQRLILEIAINSTPVAPYPPPLPPPMKLEFDHAGG